MGCSPSLLPSTLPLTTVIHRHQPREDVALANITTEANTRSPSPFSEPVLLGIQTSTAHPPSVSRTSSTLSEEAFWELEIEGDYDLKATVKEIVETEEQEFRDVFAEPTSRPSASSNRAKSPPPTTTRPTSPSRQFQQNINLAQLYHLPSPLRPKPPSFTVQELGPIRDHARRLFEYP